MTRNGGHVDAVIARIGRRQFGVAAYSQLLDAGVSRDEIRRRAASGHLIRLHQGVYAVGHTALHPLAPSQAALLAVGANALLSHITAAALHRILKAHPGPIHVTTTTRSRPRGVRIHYTGRPRERHFHQTLPLTSPLTTLLDLALTETTATTDRALAEAMALKLVTHDQIATAPPSKGSRKLRNLLEITPTITRSALERRFLQLVKRAALPAPHTNIRVGGLEVDAVWPDRKIAVELDGYAFHHSRRAFERDRDKDAALEALGWSLIRLTWRQVTDEPEKVAIRIARALEPR